MSEALKEVKQEVELTKEQQLESVLGLAKQCKHLSHDEALDLILYEDYRQLGEGHFSTVFGNDKYPDYVIKLCHRAEDSWPFYAKYCMDNVDNPEVNFLLPKVHDFIAIGQRGLYVAVLDRMQPIDRSNCVKYDELSTRQIEQIVSFSRGFRTYQYELPIRYREDMCIARYPKHYIAGDAIYNDLHKFCSIDLHGGNMMLHPDGRVIITDPVSFKRCSHEQEKSLLPEGVEPSQPKTERKRAQIRLAGKRAKIAPELVKMNMARAKMLVAAGLTKGQQHDFIKNKVHGNARFC